MLTSRFYSFSLSSSRYFRHLRLHPSRYNNVSFSFPLACFSTTTSSSSIDHNNNNTSSNFRFTSRQQYNDYLYDIHRYLPQGYQIGTTSFSFLPMEATHLPCHMSLTLIKLLQLTENYAAVFTKNKFPGTPVILGKQRLAENQSLGGILINNKIANVCSNTNGILDTEEICEILSKLLNESNQNSQELQGKNILPCSTGVIGWRLPKEKIIQQLPNLINSLQSKSIIPAAECIMTTDLYPKIRSQNLCDNKARLVGIAKGAGMIEPNMATMLSYLLTDLEISKGILQSMLNEIIPKTFNCISIDSDTSTSDTAVLVASNVIPLSQDEKTKNKQLEEFYDALYNICYHLSLDIVRNGEGIHHMIQVYIRNARNEKIAKGIGKSIVNSPLFKCAIAGNDPNIGRLIAAIGKYLGQLEDADQMNLCNIKITIGDEIIYENGKFQINDQIEKKLILYMKDAQLTESRRDGLEQTTRNYPPHNKAIEITVDLEDGDCNAVITGGDLTHDYVAINADYRS